MAIKKYDSEINEIPFKTIVRINEDGTVKDIQNKPNKKLFSEEIHISGEHIIADKPEQDHIDHFEGDNKWIERDIKDKSTKFIFRVSKDKKSATI